MSASVAGWYRCAEEQVLAEVAAEPAAEHNPDLDRVSEGAVDCCIVAKGRSLAAEVVVCRSAHLGAESFAA